MIESTDIRTDMQGVMEMVKCPAVTSYISVATYAYIAAEQLTSGLDRVLEYQKL